MIPPEEGFGEPWFPIVPAQDGPAAGGWSDLWERFRFAGVGRMPSASKLVCARGGQLSGQRKMTYRSDEAERGSGSIYGDRPRSGDPG